jgi:thiol-disulfide isomerase/thioredoxin
MLFLHITASSKNAHLLNQYVAQGKHVFALVYMEGCGPCIATRPEWAKLKSTLEDKYKGNDNVVIADINSDALNEIRDIKDVQGFPTIMYICNKGHTKEEFEKGKQLNKSRSVDAFVEWIELNMPKAPVQPPIKHIIMPKAPPIKQKHYRNKTRKRPHKWRPNKSLSKSKRKRHQSIRRKRR